MRLFAGGRGSFALSLAAALSVGATGGLLGTCGPFTDVAPDAFCPFVLEIFTLGITTGTTPSTYDPGSYVTRLQMAAFLSRTVDAALKRRSGRSLAGQFWTPNGSPVLGISTTVAVPFYLQSDGADLWVSSLGASNVYRVRASDGKLLETWTAEANGQIAIAMGRVLVPGPQNPGVLDVIDPSKPAGVATRVASNLGSGSRGITFDGVRAWTANSSANSSVSIVTPQPTIPWTVTTVTAGFFNPDAALFDGTNVWISDKGGKLHRLDSSGTILESVTVGSGAGVPVFDGANIWVPGSLNVTVIRASSGAILRVLTGNGILNPVAAAFDGERVLVSNSGNNSVSLWRAADLSFLGNFPTPGVIPWGACSDGSAFWVAIYGDNRLARF